MSNTALHKAIRATQHIEVVANRKRYMDKMQEAQAQAEQAYIEAQRAFQRAQALADEAATAFYDAVAEHYDPAEDAA